MKKIWLLAFSMCGIAMSGQVVTKTDTVIRSDLSATSNDSHIYKQRKIPIGNSCKTCTVLAIYNQKQYYSHSVKATIDTLGTNYNYEIHAVPDSILRYTSEPNIQNVIVIEKAK